MGHFFSSCWLLEMELLWLQKKLSEGRDHYFALDQDSAWCLGRKKRPELDSSSRSAPG